MTRPPLVDGFGRTVKDLRISVTDRCNFRCTYCMPEHGLDWLKNAALLTFDEIVSITSLMLEAGVGSIKLTGGEPLARADLPELVGRLRALSPSLDISMTTNGFLLGRSAGALAEAGLSRVTVSCDSLIRHRFATITRRDALAQVMEGIEAAAAVGLGPVKINTVVMRGINEDEIGSFAELARQTGYEVRFIEFMPLDADEAWTRGDVVPAAEILGLVGHDLVPTKDSGPATTYGFADGTPGTIGVIPTVTAAFCESCDRLRLTADGKLRACLFALEETDLRTVLRNGGTRDDLDRAMRGCVAAKWAGHSIGSPDFERPARSMSMIGG